MNPLGPNTFYSTRWINTAIFHCWITTMTTACTPSTILTGLTISAAWMLLSYFREFLYIWAAQVIFMQSNCFQFWMFFEYVVSVGYKELLTPPLVRWGGIVTALVRWGFQSLYLKYYSYILIYYLIVLWSLHFFAHRHVFSGHKGSGLLYKFFCFIICKLTSQGLNLQSYWIKAMLINLVIQ